MPSLVRHARAAGAALLIAALALPRSATAQRLPGTLVLHGDGAAQTSDSLRNAVRAWRVQHDVDVLNEFMRLLAIPNVASDASNIRQNANALVTMLQSRGVSTRLLETPGAPPVVYGEMNVPGATRTVVLYAHYDGQPVTASDWSTSPWAPTVRTESPTQRGRRVPLVRGGVAGNWRVYGRSAGDDKGSIIAQLSAIDALRALGVKPSVNVRFFYEGEEEAGSPHLRDVLGRYASLLKDAGGPPHNNVGNDRLAGRYRDLAMPTTVWLFGDGPVHQSGRQQVVFGVRGVTGVTLTTYGPIRALHSGHYGNWAPNPVTMLANLIASMRDNDGRIRIAGFYDDVDPITPAERAAIAAMPSMEAELRSQLQLGATEANNALLGERIMLPALNLRGISGGTVGAEAANAIPTFAQASIDFRLVPHQTPERVRALVEQHAAAQGYWVTQNEPTAAERMAHPRILRVEWEAGYPATRLAMDSPIARAVGSAVDLALGEPAVRVPTLGGSLPTYQFSQLLGAPIVVLPIANADDNQHAANENLRLQNLWDGIELYAGVLARVGPLLEGAPAPVVRPRPGIPVDSVRTRPRPRPR